MSYQEIKNQFYKKLPQFKDPIVRGSISVTVIPKPKGYSQWSSFYSLDTSKISFSVSSEHLTYSEQSELQRGQLSMKGFDVEKIQRKIDNIFRTGEAYVKRNIEISESKKTGLEVAKNLIKKNFPNLEGLKVSESRYEYVAEIGYTDIFTFNVSSDGAITSIGLKFKLDLEDAKSIITNHLKTDD